MSGVWTAVHYVYRHSVFAYKRKRVLNSFKVCCTTFWIRNRDDVKLIKLKSGVAETSDIFFIFIVPLGIFGLPRSNLAFTRFVIILLNILYVSLSPAPSPISSNIKFTRFIIFIFLTSK